MEEILFKEEEKKEEKNYLFKLNLHLININDMNVKKTFKEGIFIDDKLFKLFFDKRKEVEGEFAVIVGKKFGKAFERNKIKRIYREIIRERMKQSHKKINLLILPKSLSKEVSFQKIKYKIQEILNPSL